MNPTDSVTIALEGHTLSGLPGDLAAVLAALPAPTPQASARPTPQPSTTPRVRTRSSRRIPTLGKDDAAYLRALFTHSPRSKQAGRGALVAAHLIADLGTTVTVGDLVTRHGVHANTVKHTVDRLIQGGSTLTVVPGPNGRWTRTTEITVVRVGTPEQAAESRAAWKARYEADQARWAKSRAVRASKAKAQATRQAKKATKQPAVQRTRTKTA